MKIPTGGGLWGIRMKSPVVACSDTSISLYDLFNWIHPTGQMHPARCSCSGIHVYDESAQKVQGKTIG
jgi:hypothetical protein